MLTWRLPNDPDLTKLELRYKERGAAGEEVVVEVPAGRKFALLEGLRSETAYTVELRSYDTAGNFFSSARVEIGTAGLQTEVQDTLPPYPVSAAALKPGLNQVEVTWSDPQDSDFLAVKLLWAKSGQSLDGASPVTVNKGSRYYVISGLIPSTDYELRIWTVDAAGNESMPQTLYASTTAANGGTGTGTGTVGNTGSQGDPLIQSKALGSGDVSLSFFEGKLLLAVPAGSGGQATKITTRRIESPQVVLDSSLRIMSGVYEWKLDIGSKLLQPGKLTVSYDKAVLKGADARKLGVYRHNPLLEGGWIYAGGVVDLSAGTVEADVTEAGVYAILIAEYSFDDLGSHWSREDVEVLSSRHVINGYPDGSFRPDGIITRAEFAKLLSAFITADVSVIDRAFLDVSRDAWYAEAVAKAFAAGIVEGDDGSFRPNDPVTREEMAVMLFRLLRIDPDIKLGTAALLHPFKDGQTVSEWALTAVAYAVMSGLMEGSGDTLNPGATATRAEAAVVVLRTLTALGGLTKQP
jgi:hypothetical protein